MAFGDAEVEGRIADERELRLSFHTVALMQDELEFLLVDGSGRQQSGFHSPTEPFGHGTFNTAKMLNALLLRMGIALVDTISQGNNCHQRFTVKHLILVGLLLVGQAHPTGVQAEGLGQEHHFLAIVSEFHVIAFRPNNGNVVGYPFKPAIFCHAAGKGFWLISDQLEVQLTETDNQCGFINHDGKFELTGDFKTLILDEDIECSNYPLCPTFSEGLAWVCNKEGKFGYIDKTGKVVIPFRYEACYDDESELYYHQPCYDFHEGLARICDKTTEKYGYIDREGNEVFPCQFEYAYDLCEGLALVVRDDQYGFIDANGNCTLNLTK